MIRSLSFDTYAQRAIEGEKLADAEAFEILATPAESVFHLIASANDVRRHFKGDAIDLCAIVNVKSGACPEDCAFCAQSTHHGADAPVYPFMEREEILKNANAARKMGAARFSLVSSGDGVNDKSDFEQVCDGINAITQNTDLGRCASLGVLDRNQLEKLRAAGLERVHHNLETAESFFDLICSTHSYADRARTVKLAKEMGFYVCSGGIFGMGESPDQRIELALSLRDLDVDSVPMNFLNPIPGTPLENTEPLHPLEILKIVAMFRFMLPEKDIRICGGREVNLRSLQPLMYVAGANCVMIGNYLTTPGRDACEDIEMINDLGLNACP